MKKEDYYDRHHIIPVHPYEEEKGVRGVSTPNNIIVIQRQTHDAIHDLFKNTPPITQVVQLLTMYEKCFDEEFYRFIIKQIQVYANNWYKKECYKWQLKAEIRRVLDLNI